ncbi:MAG: DNA polymerase III subunit alpha, partial [Acidimicrobiales bacterium]
REDAVSHDALLCVQTGASIDDPKRFKFESHEHYLKTAAEMRSLFAHWPQACDNTLWVAERARVEIEFGKPKLPEFPVPQEFRSETYEESAAAYLRHLSLTGAAQRYGDPIPGEVMQRLDYELSVIADMGFSAYFLVVGDLIRHARESGIRVGPGRGSAAGCLVAYCLRIVDLDPIRYGLIFERFLNPGRKQMPDIDMDFDERFRPDMIRYAAERYGWDHVAQIVTFSTIKARAAVRDAARVLGYPYGLGDRIAKAMPPLVMGRDTPLWACLELDPRYADGYKAATELREMYEADPDCKKVIEVARGLEGLRRQDGIHAAAVVITAEPLVEYLPIQRKPDPGGRVEDAPIVTQYEMHGVEDLGLLKMDFLGLRNLSVIERSLDLVELSSGVRPDIDSIPLDDEATFAMLRRGESIGVFQLEGGPMRALMRSLAPTSFDDVAALVALYRPGPMAANMHNDYADRKNGRKPISYLHPEMAEVLGDTYGLCIYQEGMMRLAQKFAGYSLEESDNLRKAAGKKIREVMAKEREKFVSGCEASGYGAKLGTDLFDMIEPFADYAFNKSHSYGYGLVAYQTAWLKAHHPVEYLAALLTSVKDDKDKTAVYLSECRSLGIQVLVPDVNLSESDFVARPPLDGASGPGSIPFGLSAVRNVGENLVGMIVSERDKNGPFTDFYDFCLRVDPIVLNKRAIESLIKSGAFDSLGHPRKGLCMVFEQVVDRTLARRREQEIGVMSLFGAVEDPGGGPVFDDTRIPVPDLEFDKAERLREEKQMLGLYVSDHPLMGAEAALRRHTDCTIRELREGAGAREGEIRTVGGVVTGLSRRYTKRGELMATFTLEDLESAIDVFVFPKTMLEWGALLADDAVVCIKGRLDAREDEPKVVCMEVRRPELVLDGGPPLRIALPLGGLTDAKVDRLKGLLSEHPGDSPVFLQLGDKVIRLATAFNVDCGNGLMGELRVLLGASAVIT